MNFFNTRDQGESKIYSKGIFTKYENYFVFFFLFSISVFCLMVYYSANQTTLYADTMSRLDIARKVIDNINPGVPQLGNVWLPLPQVLMIPFIWNNFLWHSGLAGSFMSMFAFIVGGFYIYKSAKLLSNSSFASFLSLSLYAFNINLLYLQSTAMSESLFLTTIAAAIYYFLVWIKTKNQFYLIPAGMAISAMTFTRYEGLAILLASIPMVFCITLLRNKSFKKAESASILFTLMAITGFGLWTLYLTAIFGDPLYWVHYYATPQASGVSHTAIYSQQKSFIAAVWQYFTSSVWMDGLIPVAMAVLGYLLLLIHSIWKRTLYFVPLTMPLALFLFMVLTLQRNTPIVQPLLTISNILTGRTSLQDGFNIRYGIILLPWVSLVSVYLFRFRWKIISILFYLPILLQFYTYAVPKYTLIYQIPMKIYQKPYVALVSWMKTHYTGGKILISASSHEDQMFLMGFNYSTFIHEGAGKYWKESIDNPPRYATYIVVDYGHPQDQVARYMKDKHHIDMLNRDYNLVFNDKGDQVKVFKIKSHPYFTILSYKTAIPYK